MKEFTVFVTLLTLHSAIFAVPAKAELGMIQTLEDKLSSHKKEFRNLLKTSEKRQIFVSTLDPNVRLTVDPLFVQSIILNSKSQYLSLLGTDQCNFYSLLENNLLKTINGDIDNVVVSYKPTPDSSKKIQISKDELTRHVYKTTCFKNKDISILFNNKNRLKTISSLVLAVPDNEAQCKKIHQHWTSNPYLPYICKIPETISSAISAQYMLDHGKVKNPLRRQHLRSVISEGNTLKNDYSFFTRTYLYNLCQNIDKSEQFCKLYTSDDTWRKVTNGELPQYLISFKCRYILEKDTLTTSDLQKCRNLMLEQPSLCQMKGSGKLPSLLPRPDCNQISLALRSAKLITNYHDCPGNIDNEGITNIHRIIMHLGGRPIKSDSASCASETNYSFAKLNIDYNNDDAWPLKVCFNDPASGERQCNLFIPGHHPDSKLSETTVVAQILQRLINAPENIKCTFVDSSTFNPSLLEYRNKCFIVYDINECTTLECSKKIFYKNKIVNGLEYIGIPTFDYFPNSYKNEKFSLIEILKKTYKIQSKSLRNLTEISFHLNKKNRIIHGIGCAQDLLPRFFKKNHFNECSPLPFIIDGVAKEKGISYLATVTAVDDLHSPRLIPWSDIYSAVKTYQELHPLAKWTLHGIR